MQITNRNSAIEALAFVLHSTVLQQCVCLGSEGLGRWTVIHPIVV